MPRGGPRPNSGGRRPGAGRKPKNRETVPPVDQAQAPAGEPTVITADTPLEFLLAVVKDTGQPIDIRLKAAQIAAPFVHTRTHDGGKKEERERAAKVAATGRFAPKAPPKLVVNNQ